MNLWLRLVRVWLTARRGRRLDPREPSVIQIRVWPHDLDLWGHVNGGRYVTLSDLGRLDLFIRSGLMRAALKKGWVLPMGAVSVQFRRPLRLFQVCELHTRGVGWDDKWGYVSTSFVRQGREVASLIMRGTTKDRNGQIVPSAEVLAAIGFAGESMPVPDALRERFEGDQPASTPR